MTISVEVSVRIGRRPEAVTAVILDATKATLWTAGLEQFEVVAGEPGQVGAVGLLHYVQGRRRYVMEDTLLAAEPNRRYVSRVRGQGLQAQVETLLTPVGEDGTRVTVRWSGRGTGPLTWVVLPFMRRAIARGAETDLASLKRVVEEGPSPRAPR